MLNYVKNTTFPGLSSLLFPHSCRGCGHIGEAFCDCCKKYILNHHQNICPACKSKNPTGNCSNCRELPCTYVISDRNDILGKLIHDYKYYSIRSLAHPLAELLSGVLPTNLPPDTVIVPLPTATHHIRSRGFDHTYLIAKHLSKLRQVPILNILIRQKNTVQVGANRTDRLAQASSAYSLNPKIKIDPSATYILLDDVWTTGASIKAAKAKLESAGAKNIIIAILAYSL